MITKIRLKNWRSHLDSEFEFSEGTNGLIGIMGSGKSSVMNALTFALFGTFPDLRQRKITLDDVIMKKPKQKRIAETEVSFLLNGDKYTVFRRIGRGEGTLEASLKKNGKVIVSPSPIRVTEQIEKILDIDYELFTRAIYSEQNELDFFLRIPKGKRKKKIDDLLGIERLEKVRKGVVKLINKSKDRRNLRKEDIQRIKERVDFTQIDKLKTELEQATIELKKKEERLKDCESELEKIKNEITKLEEIRRSYEGLKEEKIRLSSRIDQISSKLQGKEDWFRFGLAELKRDLEVVEEGINEIKDLGSRISLLKEETNRIKPKLKPLDLSKLEKELNELKEREEYLYKEKTKISTQIKHLEGNLEKLRGAKEKCPVCERELTEKIKEELLKEKKSSLEELETKLKEIVSEFEEVRSERVVKEKEVKEAEKIRELEEELKEKQKQLSKYQGLKEELEKGLRKLSEYYGVKLDELVNRIQEILEVLTEKQMLDELKEKLEEVIKKISELEFDPEKIEQKSNQFNELKTEKEVLREKINSLNQMLQEKKKRLRELEEREQELKEFKLEVRYLDQVISDLKKFREAVTRSQTTLRERFIEIINETMERFWKSIYPYQDFSGVRIAVMDDDYVLQLKEREGGWVAVEGMASGGERTAACLALRIALANVLTPNLSWLILDEPTHNLDLRGIEYLAETLRERLPELVSQTFLITHEKRLEDAISGYLYILDRDKETDEPTRIIESIKAESLARFSK